MKQGKSRRSKRAIRKNYLNDNICLLNKITNQNHIKLAFFGILNNIFGGHLTSKILEYYYHKPPPMYEIKWSINPWQTQLYV